MKQPTIAQKYLALATILPVLADFIEDLRDTNVFRQRLKQRANHLIDDIRTADNKFFERKAFDMSDEEYKKKIIEMANQQSLAGIAFIQWVVSEFVDPYEQSTVHSDNSIEAEEEERPQGDKEGTPSNNPRRSKKNATGGSNASAKKNVKE
jgi:hypothetical protein